MLLSEIKQKHVCVYTNFSLGYSWVKENSEESKKFSLRKSVGCADFMQTFNYTITSLSLMLFLLYCLPSVTKVSNISTMIIYTIFNRTIE